MSLWGSCGVWPSFRSFCCFFLSWTFIWVAAKANMCVYSAINQWPGHNSLGQTQPANNLAQASHTSGVILPQTHHHLGHAAGLCAGPAWDLRLWWQVSSGVRGLAAHFMPVFIPNRGRGQVFSMCVFVCMCVRMVLCADGSGSGTHFHMLSLGLVCGPLLPMWNMFIVLCVRQTPRPPWPPPPSTSPCNLSCYSNSAWAIFLSQHLCKRYPSWRSARAKKRRQGGVGWEK